MGLYDTVYLRLFETQYTRAGHALIRLYSSLILLPRQ